MVTSTNQGSSYVGFDIGNLLQIDPERNRFQSYENGKAMFSASFIIEGQMFQASPWLTVARVVRAKLSYDVITMMVLKMMMMVKIVMLAMIFIVAVTMIVLMFGNIWDDIKVTVKRCCTVVSVAGGQTTS